ncbi:VOC family protein [Bdellovibrio sp.]|uniref:VOC family protein n=1 Tax=Bdellovibrio TaxID=958 RepID=UPI003221FC6D
MNAIKFNFDDFKGAGEAFMKTLCAKLADVGIPARSLQSDHLCFRVGTLEEYIFYKSALSSHGTILTEVPVNGRPISTFRLNSPFQTESHEIPLVELPSPKPGTSYPTGFEHAEFVVKECFTSFRSKYPNLDFIEAGNQALNPELCLKLGPGMQAKFHHLSLERVIELEEAKIKDIIFDFDGTLIKSRENIYEINRIVFSHALGRDVPLQESIEKFHPEFSRLFEAFAITCPDKQSEALSSWGLVASRFSYELFDGVVETLDGLKNRGFRLHLWTARDEHSARKILQEHRLEEYFSTLSFATAIDSKPHANSLRFDWRLADKNQVIIIGDSTSDIIGAKNIAAISGAALWDPYSKRSSLVATGADLFFDKVTDFKDWIVKSTQEEHRLSP